MFRSLREDEGTDVRIARVTLSVDGEACTLPAGAPVASALLRLGSIARLTGLSGSPRAPYCMMGVCFDCLVSIDGQGNQQACMVPVREGMVVTRQQGRREAGQ